MTAQRRVKTGSGSGTAVGVIPARYAASRFPGKPLVRIAGLPMLQRVVEGAREAKRLRKVIVATDDPRIAEACASFGVEAVLTSPDHPTGTDRIAEVAAGLGDEIIVNIQGDEPFLEGEAIERLLAAFAGGTEAGAGTIATPMASAEALYDPATVKVVVGSAGEALYFSRCPIPWRPGLWGRSADGSPCLPDRPPDPGGWLRHVGVYAYRPEVLARVTALAPTPLETAESLEQLRLLEHGVRLLVVVAPWNGISVDTPDDLERARQRAALQPGD